MAIDLRWESFIFKNGIPRSDRELKLVSIWHSNSLARFVTYLNAGLVIPLWDEGDDDLVLSYRRFISICRTARCKPATWTRWSLTRFISVHGEILIKFKIGST